MKIKVGDIVTYRGGFGSHAPKRVVVTEMELTEVPRSKYGEDVDEVTLDDVKAGLVVFGLDDGHWCYSDQIVWDEEGYR